LKRTDGKLTLTVDKNKITFNTEIKKELRAHQVPQIEKNAKTFPPYLILAERIFPKIKEQLRQLNIAYMEANGNIFLNQAQIYYFIDANKPIQTEKEKVNRAFTKTGLKVLFHFLINEQCINLPHREIAKITQVAHGNIAYILNGLEENKFLIRKVPDPYRIIHDASNTVVDLLLFGELEEAGTIKFTNRKTEISVVGLKEVFNLILKGIQQSKSNRKNPLKQQS